MRSCAFPFPNARYPQNSDCSYFRPFMSSVIKTTKPHTIIGILPCTDDDFSMSKSVPREKHATRNQSSLTCFRMFMEFRRVNVVHLSQPGEFHECRPKDATIYLDRLFERTTIFIPDPVDVVPLRRIKSGKLVAASPMTELRFPSRKKFDREMSRQTDRKRDRQMNRQTDTRIDRKIDRNGERQSKSFKKRVKPVKVVKHRLSSKSMSDFDALSGNIEREEFIYIV